MTRERLVVGCMTGTSIDAIDAALVRVVGAGLEMRAEFVRGGSRGLSPLAAELRDLADQRAMPAGQIADLSRRLAIAHADVIGDLLGGMRPDLIAVHGQTVYHKPPVTWQMFSPWPLVERFGAPVVFDLRGADVAAGGQGAPITPLADWVLLRSERPRAVVNLGGFCNVTLLPHLGDEAGLAGIRGFDVCACNHLLDAVARGVLGTAYDAGGERALAGRVHGEACEELLSVLKSQHAAGRSLGTGDEARTWIERWSTRVRPDDLAASACAGIAAAIGRVIGADYEVILAGGGAKNAGVVRALEKAIGRQVRLIDALGIPGDMRECVEMGVLGALCEDDEPITLPGVTGRAEGRVVSGCWAGLRARTHQVR